MMESVVLSKMKKSELIEFVLCLRKQLLPPEWVRQAWQNFDNLDDKTLVKLAVWELDQGHLEDAGDVLAEIQRRYPDIRVRDRFSDLMGTLNLIYEDLRKLRKEVETDC